MAQKIVSNSVDSSKVLPRCLSLCPISEFFIEVRLGDLVAICPSDDFYFALLEALATGHEVRFSALVGGTKLNSSVFQS